MKSKELIEFKTRRTTICECGQPLTHCDDVAEHGCAPEPGDFTLCVYCGMVFEFDNGNVARKASPEAVDAFKTLPEYPDLVEAVCAYREKHDVKTELKYDL